MELHCITMSSAVQRKRSRVVEQRAWLMSRITLVLRTLDAELWLTKKLEESKHGIKMMGERRAHLRVRLREWLSRLKTWDVDAVQSEFNAHLCVCPPATGPRAATFAGFAGFAGPL